MGNDSPIQQHFAMNDQGGGGTQAVAYSGLKSVNNSKEKLIRKRWSKCDF